jgi:hypothetical protein
MARDTPSAMNSEKALEICERLGIAPSYASTRRLGGPRRAEAKAALNWLARNPKDAARADEIVSGLPGAIRTAPEPEPEPAPKPKPKRKRKPKPKAEPATEEG